MSSDCTEFYGSLSADVQATLLEGTYSRFGWTQLTFIAVKMSASMRSSYSKLPAHIVRRIRIHLCTMHIKLARRRRPKLHRKKKKHWDEWWQQRLCVQQERERWTIDDITTLLNTHTHTRCASRRIERIRLRLRRIIYLQLNLIELNFSNATGLPALENSDSSYK